MNKKITSLSLAGIMLLSTASPVFAAPAEKTEVKQPNKIEEAIKKGEEKMAEAKEAGKEVAKDAKEAMTDAKEKVEEKAKEAKKDMASKEETIKALKDEMAMESKIRASEAFKNAKEDAITNYENAIAASKSIVDDEKAELEQIKNALMNLTEAKEKLGYKEEMKDAKKEEVKSMDVKASTQKVKLNGKDVVIYGYNIDGYNYFKLRDVAAVLKDTKAKFGVEYKDAMVTLTKGADYKVTESDQKEVKAMSKGMLTNDKVMVGDKALTATAYKVDDLNYYKLRDLGEALGFGVDFDKATNTILLMSDKEAAKEEKVAPKVEEVKASLEKEIAKEKAVRESEEFKNAKEDVVTNYENAIAAAKSIVADKEAKPEQIENALKALVEAHEKLGLKADAKVEEKADKKEMKEEKKDEMKKEVKETK